ncbi:hypothetical protein [Anaeromyxobacter paludicola]|uniref:Uncharacterized protein n=1 Tax=Anaeromyxobacter paludicola TaxID=2918171 RepID=A0ABM7XC91_9BACT|nr:hypothetical protein [Anaeromyxobacter paludicola]BDG09489.1 hypothetical protein AMPC_26020 [Anaeromyxobacter paludicola]
MGEFRAPAQIIFDQLSVHLGPHTARTALRTFCERALGVAPESVTREQAPRVLEALRPMLKTLLGAAQSEALLDQLRRELG